MNDKYCQENISVTKLLQKLIKRALAQDPKTGNQHRLAQKSEVNDTFISRAIKAFPDKVKVNNIFGLLKGLGLFDFRMVAEQILECKTVTNPQEKIHMLTKEADSILKKADVLRPFSSEQILRGMQLDLIKIERQEESLKTQIQNRKETEPESFRRLELILSLKGKCLWVSEDFYRFFRKSEKELLNQNMFEVMKKNNNYTNPRMMQYWMDKIIKEKVAIVTFKNNPSFNRPPARWIISPIIQEDNKIVGFRVQGHIVNSKENDIKDLVPKGQDFALLPPEGEFIESPKKDQI